jgi:hypothetical protein
MGVAYDTRPGGLDEIGYWANEPSKTVEELPGMFVVHGGKGGAKIDHKQGRRAIYSYFRDKPQLLEHGYDPISLTPEAARAYLAGEEVRGMEGGVRPVWIRKDRDRHY